jgi:uncharacterized hydrophobic protein (TIGR00271 family)
MKKISALLNLLEGEGDREKTLESVKSNVRFKGANLWILACAIMVCSVGLNVNSTAVIIGAMLISPLMGPIVGAGFALGIYDFTLLKASLRNLLIATIVSLAVSTLYFYVSPFKDVQSELLARTAPNIYDILIAFFGGLVGIIAVTRVEKGNPIPGVAIATALMPPLCTAGYGIATAQWSFFLGAIYLYCINCVFIGIATFLIIKYLKYPAKRQVDVRHQKQVRLIITTLIIVMIVPSSYLAYSLYYEQQFKKNTDAFIENEFVSKGYTVVYKKTSVNKPRKIELAFLQKRFNSREIKVLQQRIAENKYLKGASLIIRQDSTDRLTALKGDILNEIRSSENEINQKDIKILRLEKELAQNRLDNQKLLKETKALFSGITAISISKQTLINEKDSVVSTVTAVIYSGPKELSDPDRVRLRAWLNERLSVKNVEVFRKQ